MRNLDNSWYSTKLNILECIEEAGCWYEIERATSAMFHARLVYKRTQQANERDNAEQGMCEQRAVREERDG